MDEISPSSKDTRLAALSGAAVRLGGRTVLHDIDFDISRGEIVTVVGPNGSGKSTLLRLLVGAIDPVVGTTWRRDGLRIGYVPQKLHIDPTLPVTVRRFLSLPNRLPARQIDNALQSAGVPHLATAQMATLSGGEFQRVMLARAILADPQLLILDEATQGLDQSGSIAFYNRIASIRETLGCAVLMVSHELHVVMAASDRVICLNGHVCCQGTPEHVSSAPEYLALFGDTSGALAVYRHEHDHDHHDHHDHHHHHHRDHHHDGSGASS